MNVRSKSQWKPVLDVLVAALRVMLLLSLVLCLPQQPVQAQAVDPPPASESGAASEVQAPENGTGLQAPAVPLACDPLNPLPGKTARVVGDDEIMVSYILTEDWTLRGKVLNGANGTLTGVFDRVYDDTSFPGLSHSAWPSAAASDLNADHKAELVVGLKNAWENISAIVDPVSSTPATGSDWLKNDDRNSGGWVWDVSAAAGNLDSSADGTDEIVLAYRDDAADYHVIGLDGNSAGTAIANGDNAQSIEYWEDHSPGNERGDIHHMSVATGDLNGDGSDNEIVTAFKDSGSDLQVVALRPNWPAGTATIIMYWDSWGGQPQIDDVAPEPWTYPNRRAIDVTTGDIDGDMKDEIVVAARSGVSSSLSESRHFATGRIVIHWSHDQKIQKR